MRRWIALAALVTAAALAVPPAAPAAPKTILVDAAEAGVASVDLVDDPTANLLFRVDESNFTSKGPLQSVYVRLVHSGEPPMDLAMVRSAGNWTVVLPVQTPDLVVGTWEAGFKGVRSNGTVPLSNRTLDVTAQDTKAPEMVLKDPATPVLAGPGDTIPLTVTDALLRSVTFTFPGLAQPLPLSAPYALRADLLPVGLTPVTFEAADRAGHANKLTVDVDRDPVPPAVNLTVPEHAYAGVPFAVQAVVAEDGPYTVRLSSNGTLLQEAKVQGTALPGGTRTSAFTVAPPDSGNVSLLVEVVDRVGSRAVDARVVALERPVTDLRVEGLSADGVLFAQRTLHVAARVSQQGVATLDVPVALSDGGQTQSSVVQLGPTATKEVGWDLHLPGGRHTLVATAQAPASANETNPGDESATLEVEVFLGRVLSNGTAYDIRAGANGLPSAAVEEGKAASYTLQLVDNGRGVAYRFTLPDNRTVDWDPLDPLGEAAAASSSSSGTTSGSATGGSKSSPGAGPLMALLVVALAALGQRRRL